jgi:hypothetical protein
LQAGAASQKAAALAALKAAGGLTSQSVIIQAGRSGAGADFNAAEVAIAQLAPAAGDDRCCLQCSARQRLHHAVPQAARRAAQYGKSWSAAAGTRAHSAGRYVLHAFPDGGHVAGAGGDGGGSVVVVNNIERINQLLAQCTYQPGLAAVLGDVLQQSREGAEFYEQVGAGCGRWLASAAGGSHTSCLLVKCIQQFSATFCRFWAPMPGCPNA